MTQTILLTRAISFNMELKDILQEYGYNILECNLIHYELQPIDNSLFQNFTDLVITSFFAATKLPNLSGKTINVWVVGNKSAKILAEKGYIIKFIANNAVSLKHQLNKYREVIGDNILYLSSDHLTVNMPRYVVRKIFYRVIYKKSLSPKEISFYKQNINYIFLYSENCAKTLIKLLLDNNLMVYLKNTTYIVISSKIEKVIKKHFANTKICKDDELLKFLQEQN